MEVLYWLSWAGAVSCLLYNLYLIGKERKEAANEADHAGQEGHGDDL